MIDFKQFHLFPSWYTQRLLHLSRHTEVCHEISAVSSVLRRTRHPVGAPQPDRPTPEEQNQGWTQETSTGVNNSPVHGPSSGFCRKRLNVYVQMDLEQKQRWSQRGKRWQNKKRKMDMKFPSRTRAEQSWRSSPCKQEKKDLQEVTETQETKHRKGKGSDSKPVSEGRSQVQTLVRMGLTCRALLIWSRRLQDYQSFLCSSQEKCLTFHSKGLFKALYFIECLLFFASKVND